MSPHSERVANDFILKVRPGLSPLGLEHYCPAGSWWVPAGRIAVLDEGYAHYMTRVVLQAEGEAERSEINHGFLPVGDVHLSLLDRDAFERVLFVAGTRCDLGWYPGSNYTLEQLKGGHWQIRHQVFTRTFTVSEVPRLANPAAPYPSRPIGEIPYIYARALVRIAEHLFSPPPLLER